MEQFRTGSAIVVGVDGSKANRDAVEWAVHEARARYSKLLALYAWHVPSLAYSAPGYVPISADETNEAGRELLRREVLPLAQEAGLELELRSLEGPAAKVIRAAAADEQVALVVVGSRGRGALARLVLGSVSHGLSHNCPKPLVIVPHHEPPVAAEWPFRHIVVGIDGSDGADAALRWAAVEASLHDAVLEVAMAWSWTTLPPGMILAEPFDESLEKSAHQVLTEAVSKLGPTDVKIKFTVQPGSAVDVLLESSHSADLLVVGTRGHGRAQEMALGSTSHACAHLSRVPVAIIPQG